MQGGGANVHSQVDMYTCTDEYTHTQTHSNLGVKLQKGRMGQTCRAKEQQGKQFCMQLCKGSEPDVGSQVGMHKCPDVCTYSNCLVSSLHMIATG